ncbi:MAG TPA: zf-HC2 domain-containing protein, partial [Terriglobales bacterium]
MKDVPKFVRQRMAQPVGVDHPEANLLAAFAEGGLTMRERELVLSHLGKCATCRETLAVAMPEITAEHPHAAATPSGTRWLRWPMLRWAGVGAAVVVVAAAVVIQSSRRPAEVQRPSLAAPADKSEQAKESAKPAAADEVAPVLADRVSRNEAVAERDMRAKAERRADKKKDAVAGQSVNSAPAPAPANEVAESNAPLQSQAGTESYAAAKAARVQQPGFREPSAPVAGVVAMEEKQQKQQQVATPASQAQKAGESAEVFAQADVAQMQKTKSQDRAQSDLDGVKAGRARPAANSRATAAVGSAGVAGAVAPPPAAVTGGPLMKAAISIPSHWRLSSEGALERS